MEEENGKREWHHQIEHCLDGKRKERNEWFTWTKGNWIEHIETTGKNKGEAFIRNMTFKGLWLLSLWTFHRWGNCNQGLLCDSSLWVSFRSCSSCRSWACSTTSPRWPSAVCQTKPYVACAGLTSAVPLFCLKHWNNSASSDQELYSSSSVDGYA